MNNNKVLIYLMEKEKRNYIESVARWNTFKHICIALIIAITICVCCYMYYVVPEEETRYEANNGSQIVDSSLIGRDNNNGLQSY